MSKRKNRTAAPNLPQETLERARRQAAIARGELPPDPEPEAETAQDEQPRLVVAPVVENPYRTVSASGRSRRIGTARTNRERESKELTQEEIAERLANPTKFVSEEDLKRDYGYVLADIRSMFVLAAGLIVAMVALATVLPR